MSVDHDQWNYQMREVSFQRAQVFVIGLVSAVTLVNLRAEVDFKRLFGAYYAGNDSVVNALLFELAEGQRFALGMASYDERELPLARQSFNAILDRNPEHQRARLELARVLLEMRDFTQAEVAFRQVLDINPPEQVEENIHRYLNRIAQLREASRIEASASSAVERQNPDQRFVIKRRTYAGVTYDSNVNFGPEDNVVDVAPFQVGGTSFNQLEISGDSDPESAYGVFAFVQVAVDQALDEEGRMQAIYEVEYYQNWLNDVAEFELLNLGLSAGLRLVGPRSFVEMPVKYSVVQLGGEDFLGQTLLSPSYVQLTKSGLQAGTRLQIRFNDYETSEELDGVEYTFEQEFLQKYDADIDQVSVTFGGFLNEARSATYSYRGWLARSFGQVEIPHGFVASGLAELRQSYYDEREPLAPEDREDFEISGSVGVYRLFPGDWMGALNYQYFWVDSTFDLYSYERNMVTLSTAKEF